jgi:hypothetical protein
MVPDQYGRTHGLQTKEYLALVKKGETMPILKEVFRRPDLQATYETILELLLADEESHLPPLDLVRVALYTMRELQLLGWELQFKDLEKLPEHHPKLANSIQRASQHMDDLRQKYRQEREQGGLFEYFRQNLTKLKLEMEFEEKTADEGVEFIEGAFRRVDIEEDDDDESYGDSEGV